MMRLRLLSEVMVGKSLNGDLSNLSPKKYIATWGADGLGSVALGGAVGSRECGQAHTS